MNDSRRLGMPILVMVVFTTLFYLINTYLHSEITNTILTIIFDISLFMFGVTLNGKKKSHSVYRKVLALVLTIILVFIQLGVVSMPFVATLQTFFSINPYLISMLFIYFGFLFMD
ncbi:MAG: amino acid permease [Longicatena sp.]